MTDQKSSGKLPDDGSIVSVALISEGLGLPSAPTFIGPSRPPYAHLEGGVALLFPVLTPGPNS